MQETNTASAAQRLSRILASLGDGGSSTAMPTVQPQSPASPIDSLLYQRQVKEANGHETSGVVYSESVASAMALASQISRSKRSPRKVVESLTSSPSSSSSSAAAAAAQPSSSSAPPPSVIASSETAAATSSSSVVRVRSDRVVSREKNIDSSLVSLLQRYKQIELSSNQTEGARVEKEIDVILQRAYVAEQSPPAAIFPAAYEEAVAHARHAGSRSRSNSTDVSGRVEGGNMVDDVVKLQADHLMTIRDYSAQQQQQQQQQHHQQEQQQQRNAGAEAAAAAPRHVQQVLVFDDDVPIQKQQQQMAHDDNNEEEEEEEEEEFNLFEDGPAFVEKQMKQEQQFSQHRLEEQHHQQQQLHNQSESFLVTSLHESQALSAQLKLELDNARTALAKQVVACAEMSSKRDAAAAEAAQARSVIDELRVELREQYKVHAQRKFEENVRQQQQDKQHSLLLLELDKNRLLIDRLVSDNGKLIAAIDAAHEYVSQLEGSAVAGGGDKRSGGPLAAMMSLPPSQRHAQTWRFPTPNSRRQARVGPAHADEVPVYASRRSSSVGRSSSAGRVRREAGS